MNDLQRAAYRLDAIAEAVDQLGDEEAVDVFRDLARVMRDPSYRASWLTDEKLTPIATAVNTDPADHDEPSAGGA
jgi:hypothetical protein